MSVSKKNQYVILLLVVVIFVSLSFFVILNMPFREGFNAEDDPTMDLEENTKEVEDSPLQKKDALTIQNKCVVSFTKKINDLMKNKYRFNIIYDEIEQKQKKGKKKNPSQSQLNAYFKDPSSVTIQDMMDKVSDNISLIRENPVFKAKPRNVTNNIVNYITEYKKARELPSSDIKQIYTEYISCIETELKTIADRNENSYADSTLTDMIKREKKNPSYYGLNSTFHKLRTYIKLGIENKLNVDAME